MTQQHQVPSQELWGITPFRFTTPEGWSVRQTVDQLAYMSRDDEPSTNCGVQWKRVSATLELRQVAQMSRNVLNMIDPGAAVGVSRFGKLHGRVSYLRISEFTTKGGVRTGQVYITFFGPRFAPDRPVELFEIFGHFDVANGNRLDEIEAIAKSFRFLIATTPSVTGSDDTPADDAAADDTIAKGA